MIRCEHWGSCEDSENPADGADSPAVPFGGGGRVQLAADSVSRSKGKEAGRHRPYVEPAKRPLPASVDRTPVERRTMAEWRFLRSPSAAVFCLNIQHTQAQVPTDFDEAAAKSINENRLD